VSRLLWLPNALAAEGLYVVEVPGWRTRGAGTMHHTPTVVVAHHTATPARQPGDYPSLGIVRDGRRDLRGPLSHLGLGRSGRVYVIASGKANHAGVGRWQGVTSSIDTIGIEAEHPGTGGTPWPQEQLDAYDRVCAALLRYTGRPAGYLCAHREWALPPGRKPDPTGIDMHAMRRRVADLLARREPATVHPTIDAEPLVAELPVLTSPSKHRNVRTLQGLLCAAASVQLCPAVEVDQDFGPKTRASLLAYQRAMRLPESGGTDEQTWRALLALPYGTAR